jgi:hypothetical protein
VLPEPVLHAFLSELLNKDLRDVGEALGVVIFNFLIQASMLILVNFLEKKAEVSDNVEKLRHARVYVSPVYRIGADFVRYIRAILKSEFWVGCYPVALFRN